MYDEASSPVRKGSSEKYSKFLPHRGFLWILIAGARMMSTPYSYASFPIASPVFLTAAVSQLAAREIPVGNAVQ